MTKAKRPRRRRLKRDRRLSQFRDRVAQEAVAEDSEAFLDDMPVTGFYPDPSSPTGWSASVGKIVQP